MQRKCTYDNSDWAGLYDATESSEFFGGYGPYDVTLAQDVGNPNRFNINNWYDSGIPIYIIFQPSVDVVTQVVTAPAQKHPNGVRTISAEGTYNQCTNEITLDFLYVRDSDGEVLDKFIWKLKKK